eukprot:CAMPEP_0182908430 /NCGR_PEP_ID=MMETSP0034_2-20130328/35209_1 /TAXON_ID=156128 /ORGANISM="Nephroselmis pyriformis, Strain CCMP717" /LENGTH=44 /DNA_ID= /DNA_START= /DNA_END= /DNA_ORIENTATION=
MSRALRWSWPSGAVPVPYPGEHDDAPVVADLEDVRALLHLVPRA